jgi:hypothetical protein
MKKTTKRLALSKQTLRNLTSLDLGRAAGAKDPDSEGLTCFCSETCTACPTHYFSGCAGCAFTDAC